MLSVLSVITAYLCCQISKWVGLLAYSLRPEMWLYYTVRIRVNTLRRFMRTPRKAAEIYTPNSSVVALCRIYSTFSGIGSSPFPIPHGTSAQSTPPERPLHSPGQWARSAQVSKWVGLVAVSLTDEKWVYYAVRTVVTALVFYLFIRYVSDAAAQLLAKPTKDIAILGLMPLVYYLYDYATNVYTELLYSGRAVIAEFLGFVLCIARLLMMHSTPSARENHSSVITLKTGFSSATAAIWYICPM